MIKEKTLVTIKEDIQIEYPFSDDLPTKALGIVPHDVKELPRQCIVKYLTIVVISLVNMVGI